MFQIYMRYWLDLFLTRLCLEKLSAAFPLVFPDASTNISRFGEITLGRLRMHAISEFFGDAFTNDPTIYLRVKHSLFFLAIYIINIHYFPQLAQINCISFFRLLCFADFNWHCIISYASMFMWNQKINKRIFFLIFLKQLFSPIYKH